MFITALTMSLLFVLFLTVSAYCSGGENWLITLERLNANVSDRLSERLYSVNLKEITHPEIVIDLKYATPDNPAKKVIYKHAVCLLHHDAAEALGKASEIAGSMGLKLKISDSFRPAECDIAISNDRDCPRSFNHSRGITVDLCLIDARTHEELDCGANDKELPLSELINDLTLAQIQNRLLLAGIMSAVGFIAHRQKWGRFDFAYPAHVTEYPILFDSKLRTGMMSE